MFKTMIERVESFVLLNPEERYLDYIKKNPESKTLDNDNSTLKIPPEGYILPIPKPKNE